MDLRLTDEDQEPEFFEPENDPGFEIDEPKVVAGKQSGSSFDQLFGQQELVAKAMKLIQSKSLPPALLILGQDGLGQKKFALGVAQALVCEVVAEEEKNSHGPCGACGPCVRVFKESSESLLQVAPQKGVLRVDVAREIVDFLQLRSVDRARVIFVQEAHRLNTQAANMLLKSVEEPPNGTFFILTAPSRSHMLPTLASRCQSWLMRPVSLKKFDEFQNLEEWLLRAAEGRPERVESLRSEASLHSRRLALEVCEYFFAEEDLLASEELGLDSLKHAQEGPFFFFWMQLFLRDLLLLRSLEGSQVTRADLAGQPNIFSVDLHDRLASLLSWSPQAFSFIFRSMLQLEKSVQMRDTTLALQQIWYRLHQENF